MRAVDLETARLLLDFTGGNDELKQLGELQLKGAVALQNMIADPATGLGYLADEVGMGKTYIALGVVALMRYFNPGYRVLYICPSRNVQEKWYDREHPNFIKHNVLTRNFKIRTPEGEPGTPTVFCNNVEELIEASTTGYYGDVFVRMSSFSMGMGDDEEGLDRHRRWLESRVPENVLNTGRSGKEQVKENYARALNYLLPTFDLVVIDEAHNFKHDFESSDRNKALSRILGFSKEQDYHQRVKNALLLSATPFDVNPAHLYNQLKLVGKENLLPEKIWYEKDQVKKTMARFMVRRLNKLTIRGEPHTRNMYRREWRKGERVEIDFETDEHKLVTALVQKHVGDLLNREGGNPSFQMGLLASFESYAQTTGSGPVEFDGERTTETPTDAMDRHLIAVIRDSYVEAEKFGKSLPHPKMDQVCRDVSQLAFQQARKQLVFVRRVKSVAELKQKIDDCYNEWLKKYIDNVLKGNEIAASLMDTVYTEYSHVRKDFDEDISGIEYAEMDEDGEKSLPPKNDTLFSWFFRGEPTPELKQSLESGYGAWRLPVEIRKSLSSKKDKNVLLFEFNWVDWVARKIFDRSVNELLQDFPSDFERAVASLQGMPEDDKISAFLSVQRAFLQILSKHHMEHTWLYSLGDYLSPLIRKQGDYRPGVDTARELLTIPTFFTWLMDLGLDPYLFGSPRLLLEQIREQKDVTDDQIQRVEIHRQLVAQAFRTGHGMIDLYLARLLIGAGELQDDHRQDWLDRLCKILKAQLQGQEFTTAIELSRLNDNLDLVIKSNLPEAYKKSPAALRRWLQSHLQYSAPVIGANGSTSDTRSAQARKFRMPGYPLVLVSTDVFQEGEDLHTFCDSVVHYGISHSPVSIEQKTGRVDRVGADAHRRLLNIKPENAVQDEDYIQVSFPFVRQSIEAVQVRVLCNRMNDFIGSLHEIGGKKGAMEEFVDSSRELANRNEIPDQLLSLLESPYDREIEIRATPDLEEKIRKDNEHSKKAVEYLKNLVSQVAGEEPGRQNQITVNHDDGSRSLYQVHINSARSCGEILLRVVNQESFMQEPVKAFTHKKICDKEAELYQSSYCRTYGIVEDNGLTLYHDAEMLAGGDGLTSEQDIQGLFNCFHKCGSEAVISKTKLSDIEAWLKGDIDHWLSERYQWKGKYSWNKKKDCIELRFRFNDDNDRGHAIKVTLDNQYCVFEAMVADRKTVKGLSAKQLLDLTWSRNSKIDLVGFSVNSAGDLVGRCVHPLGELDFEEFVFCAYVLAVESDRLEYFIKVPDEY